MHTDSNQSEGFAPGDNAADLVRGRRLTAILGAAIGSGLLLSASFPPLEVDALAWVALVPILLAPASRRLWVRLLAGYLFGFAHTFTNLFWLNTIGFGAGVLLAIYCAVFPAAWYMLAVATANPPRSADDLALRPASPILSRKDRPLAQLLQPFLLASTWVTLEWVRGWLLTGFPWNQLAVTQWRHGRLIVISRLTGVYGLSFAIVAVNVVLAYIVAGRLSRPRVPGKRPVPWAPLAVSVPLVVMIAYCWNADMNMVPDRELKIVGVQGNIPQCRIYTDEQLQHAKKVYRDLTLAAATVPDVDLCVWPESALPAALLWNRESADMLANVLAALDSQLLAGSINFAPFTNRDGEDDIRVFNSALHFSREGHLIQTYDKIHRVPFGEYVPFSKYLPWLVDFIGMGRDLTPGAEYTLFQLEDDVRAGVNICFEDAFPRISRQFTRRGADLLMTITNDAWYAESSGSRQHMVHAIFRAVENRRPLFRSGNNSDTCLIMPDGRVVGLLVDPVTGDRFVRGYKVYRVPVELNAPVTFYTRYGDLFAGLCVGATVVCLGCIGFRWYRRKRALREAVDQPSQ